ncbi:MAG: hypothetical protein E7426_01480 [Ruminococcaceae bacterium]|nr:hypothetical protein [Oscillospiraceae bacterium]
MPVIELICSKRLWLGLAMSIALFFLMSALGALLITRGWLSRDTQSGWVCISYALASAAGVWVAAAGKKKPVINALTVAALLLSGVCTAAVFFTGGISLSESGWKIFLSIIGSCLFTAVLRAGKKGHRLSRRRGTQTVKRLKNRR